MTREQELRAEIELLQAESDISDGLLADAKAEIKRLKTLLRRHQAAAWCEDDSDLAVETRAALARKEG